MYDIAFIYLWSAGPVCICNQNLVITVTCWGTVLTAMLDMISSNFRSPSCFHYFALTRWRHSKWPQKSLVTLRICIQEQTSWHKFLADLISDVLFFLLHFVFDCIAVMEFKPDMINGLWTDVYECWNPFRLIWIIPLFKVTVCLKKTHDHSRH